MVEINGCNFIAGKASAQGKESYQSINPKTHETSTTYFSEATENEIDLMMSESTEAFQTLQQISAERLSIFLQQVSKEIFNLGDQLLNVAHWETALSLQRLKNERTRTCNQLSLFAEFISKKYHIHPVIDTSNKNNNSSTPDIRKMLIPIGPVVVFPASNFPFAFGVCGGDTASAWAAGCPVICKSHPLHPQTSELFSYAVYNAIKKSDMPKGMFSLLHGKNIKTINKLVSHPCVEAVGFTGSLNAGRAIFDIAAKRKKPIPVYAEMGSNNPVFITKNVLHQKGDEIAQMLADSITLGVGQFCTKPGLIFIPEKQDSFIHLMAKLLREKQQGILLSNTIKNTLEMKVDQLGLLENVNLLCRDEHNQHNCYSNALYLTNAKMFVKEKFLHDEFFGPIAILVEYNSMVELKEIISNFEGQLTATFHLTEDDYQAMKPLIYLMMQKVGRIIFNGVPTGVEVCYAMQHGGPYPATTASHSTSVGMESIFRFLRPVAFQDMPEGLLPNELKDENNDNILRLINKEYTKDDIEN